MKKVTFTVLFLLAVTAGFCGTTTDSTRFIEVNGEAEMEVEADKITIEYTLSYKDYSYGIDQPATITTPSEPDSEEPSYYAPTIEDMEKDIKNFLKKSGVSEMPTEKFQPSKSFSRGKQYSLTLTNAGTVNRILVALDSLGAKEINISEVSHSKLAAYKAEVERKALVAAKEKAVNLLSVFNEKPGRVLQISEKPLNPFDDFFPEEFADGFKKIFTKGMPWPMQDLKIKVKYSVRIKFAIGQ